MRATKKNLLESMFRINELAEIEYRDMKTQEAWAILLESRQYMDEAMKLFQEEMMLKKRR